MMRAAGGGGAPRGRDAASAERMASAFLDAIREAHPRLRRRR